MATCKPAPHIVLGLFLPLFSLRFRFLHCRFLHLFTDVSLYKLPEKFQGCVELFHPVLLSHPYIFSSVLDFITPRFPASLSYRTPLPFRIRRIPHRFLGCHWFLAILRRWRFDVEVQFSPSFRLN